jgi:hypothetical protein
MQGAQRVATAIASATSSFVLVSSASPPCAARAISEVFISSGAAVPQVAHRAIHVTDQGQPTLNHRGAPFLRLLLLNMSHWLPVLASEGFEAHQTESLPVCCRVAMGSEGLN